MADLLPIMTIHRMDAIRLARSTCKKLLDVHEVGCDFSYPYYVLSDLRTPKHSFAINEVCHTEVSSQVRSIWILINSIKIFPWGISRSCSMDSPKLRIVRRLHGIDWVSRPFLLMWSQFLLGCFSRLRLAATELKSNFCNEFGKMLREWRNFPTIPYLCSTRCKIIASTWRLADTFRPNGAVSIHMINKTKIATYSWIFQLDSIVIRRAYFHLAQKITRYRCTELTMMCLFQRYLKS